MVKLPDSCRKVKSRLIAPFGKTSANLASAFWGVQHRPSQEIGTDVDTADFLQRQWLPLWQLLRKCSILPQPKHFVDHSTFHSTSFDLRNSDAVRIKTAFHTSDRSADGEDSAGALEHKVCLSSRFPSGQCLVLNHLRKHPEIQNRFFLPTRPIASGGNKTRDSDHNQHCPATPTRCLHSYRDSLLTSRNIWGI